MEASEELVQSCWAEAYRIAYSVLRNRADAEDAAQEACAQLTTRPELKHDRVFRRWFYRVAVRKAYDVVRRTRRERRLQMPPNVASANAEQSADLALAMERLSDTQRLAIIFTYYYGFSDAETAHILGTTHVAIRVRLFAARRSLKRLLAASFTEGEICHEQS